MRSSVCSLTLLLSTCLAAFLETGYPHVSTVMCTDSLKRSQKQDLLLIRAEICRHGLGQGEEPAAGSLLAGVRVPKRNDHVT